MTGTKSKPIIFFSNPKVSPEALLAPHFEHTVERIKTTNSEYILAIQDITTLNFSSHKAKTEIGRIGRVGSTEQYGLFQHSTLCISDKNECMGLIGLQHFDNDDFDNVRPHHERSIEDKKTTCWIDALKNMRSQLGTIEKKIITVADREGDFFEFLHVLHVNNESFVIRAMHNRHTGEKHRVRGEKLFDLLEKQSDKGEMDVIINDVKTHQLKEIKLKLKSLKVIQLPVPDRGKKDGKKGNNYKPITLNVVKAYNDDYCWVLLTNLPVDTLEECIHVTMIYKSRWHIEDYHKILKTAYQVDEIYLHSSREAIENALVMLSISACRMYWMIYMGRVENGIKADSIFREYEWKAIYVYFKEPIPPEIPPLSDVIIKIAKLGGYITKNAKPPGIKVMWIGFQLFNVAAEMYKNALST